jgi:Tfp pilus assembly protein PilF
MRFKLLRSILIGAALLVIVESRNAGLVAGQEDATAQRMEARKWLNDGVQAYKNGQIDEAIDDFQKAKDLDPSLVNAQLYLATAHSAQYILRQDYSDAMAYLNLLYWQKADMEVDPADREKDIRIADDLVDQAKAIMAKKSSQSPQQ